MLLKKTQSICPECFKELEAEIISENNKVFLTRKCSKHGIFKAKISSDVKYFSSLLEIMKTMPEPVPQNPELVVMPVTSGCNLNCPICYVDTHKIQKQLSLDTIKERIDNIKAQRINIFGGEPTVRRDLPEIISYIRKKRMIPVLFTNGLKLADAEYTLNLKKAGLKRVFLQFDGFKRTAYEKLRGRDILNEKIEALVNLGKLKIQTVLEVTIASNINDDQIYETIKFATSKKFIKAVSFRSYSYLGTKLNKKHSIDAQKMIHLLEEQSKGKIRVKDILDFNKFFFRYTANKGQPNCIYMNFFAVDRKFNPINKYFRFSKNLDPISMFRLSGIPLYFKLAKNLFRIMNKKSLMLEDIDDSLLALTFETQCDSHSYDLNIAKYCRGHDMTLDGKIMLTGEANIFREKSLKAKTK